MQVCFLLKYWRNGEMVEMGTGYFKEKWGQATLMG